jgi:hypothetical protein
VDTMKAGGIYVYSYQDMDFQSVGQFEVRSRDCGV